MPIYSWKNTVTGEIVEVERPMSEHNIPPDEGSAEGTEWERVLGGFAAKVTGGTSPARGSVSYGRKK